ncbi:ribonuclease R family protein [Paracidobacterium acidisoli]|uniref:Ribonuclease R n=1 Tax=Paracidobacterium acidisoli TaxID=2303751 RepID=A0A372IM87_9BACT|nr:VacB/RNase II family 3'-5' exoribonuclease [Paracidobacterium acidisoli]MBT9331606.1 VacB/RNase II family 3'-5' exoribonuclease [Paracidobacterium acidisoli]
MTDRELLRHIERSPGSRAGYKQLVREFGLGGGRERRLLLEHLARLTLAGRLTKTDREQWSIAKTAHTRDNLVAGRLDLHRDGFGFVRAADRKTGDDDIFIPPNEMQGAMQGDQVLVELAPPRGDGRRSGRIVRVLTRRNPTVVGIFHYARSERAQGHHVVPFDERMTQPIVIPFDSDLPEPGSSASPHRVLGEEARHAYSDLEGLVVDVEITDWPGPTHPARGRVLEVLGDEDDFGVDVEMIIRKHQLPRIFPENVLAEARSVAHLDPVIVAARRDFRHLPIVTIDGETARDFDDAVLVRHHGDGTWELQVHIADVAQYVTPGSSLDLEARLRGTSVYFPDRAIPMLPQKLSSDICSLRPAEDRLVLSCLMRIDEHGAILGYEVSEGVIRSARRMTYTQVHAILDADPVVRDEFRDLVPEFERMHELALILNRKRERRGSIDFDLPEPIIEFDQFGAMKAVTRSERNWAHRLIEEFMLAANECVASWLENLSVASLYRIHEKPEPRRIVEFEDTAAAFGYSLGIGNLPVKRFTMKSERREYRTDRRSGGNHRSQPHAHEIPDEIPVTPQMYQKLAAKISGKPEERILSYLMLRSLKQARYSEKNEGHFALAAPCYTHFTSPIRRYPDLIVHRITKALLHRGIDGHGILSTGEPHAKKPSRPAAQSSPSLLIESIDEDAALPVEAPGFSPVHEPLDEESLNLIATESSETERRADAAERELVEWKKIKFMKDRVGEEFSAMILSATKYGLFVELDDLFVEGLVPIQSLGALDNDYYSFRENTRQIIGERWGRKFSIGQRTRVVLDRVDAVEKRLQFSILLTDDQLSAAATARPAKPSRKAAKKAEKKKKKRFDASAVPAFAEGVARPPDKSRRGKKKKSMQQAAGPKRSGGKGKRHR